ncbi:hypothetical protein RHGRI_011473 [Rhododendron griersonianum]|uniref:Cysteine-rich transmembrane domain-containing protein n=1 Tax=Rhododendron griersonianum TaxID=479676 RepID=A0AAV6KMN6_9ERIC|nr:hypothetical protein RHGRI_011473 [Rhododendron griersonianum]
MEQEKQQNKDDKWSVRLREEQPETRPPFTLDLPLTAQRKEKRGRDQLELIRRPPTKAALQLRMRVFPAAYPPPLPPSTAAYFSPYVVPPPMGYPMKDTQSQINNFPPPGKAQARGDGFWKGCCAALCCCCVLDACF